MSRSVVNSYACKLRLLSYGLVDELANVDALGGVKSAKSKAAKATADDSDDEEDDDESIMDKRTAYVNKAIKEAKKSGKLDGLMAGAKNPIAAEHRRELVKTFLKDINASRKCANCNG